MNFCSVRKYEKRPFSFSALPYTRIKLWLQPAKLGRSHIYAYGIPTVSRRCPFWKMSIHTALRAWLLTPMDRCVSFLIYVFLNESLNWPEIIILMATTLAASPWKHPRIPHWLASSKLVVMVQPSQQAPVLVSFSHPTLWLVSSIKELIRLDPRGVSSPVLSVISILSGLRGCTKPFAQSTNPAGTLCLCFKASASPPDDPFRRFFLILPWGHFLFSLLPLGSLLAEAVSSSSVFMLFFKITPTRLPPLLHFSGPAL